MSSTSSNIQKKDTYRMKQTVFALALKLDDLPLKKNINFLFFLLDLVAGSMNNTDINFLPSYKERAILYEYMYPSYLTCEYVVN